jgi:hypothetical protein
MSGVAKARYTGLDVGSAETLWVKTPLQYLIVKYRPLASVTGVSCFEVVGGWDAGGGAFETVVVVFRRRQAILED